MTVHHKTLTVEKWVRYPMREQMLMIGSEFSRIMHLKREEDQKRCLERAYELIDLTLTDPKWRERSKELLRLREVLGEEYVGPMDLKKIEQYYTYCLHFARLN